MDEFAANQLLNKSPAMVMNPFMPAPGTGHQIARGIGAHCDGWTSGLGRSEFCSDGLSGGLHRSSCSSHFINSLGLAGRGLAGDGCFDACHDKGWLLSH